MAQKTQTRLLKERFQEAAKASEQVPLEVFLLYDASGSVSDADFQQAKYAGMMLTSSFGDSAMVGFGQFSTTFSLEHPVSTDLANVRARHQAMVKKSGGTNTADALKNAAVQLASPRKAQKLVVLFTDGAPENQQQAIQAASLVQASGAQIIGVGIGSVQQLPLEQVCGVGNVFILQNWSDLLNAIPTAADREAGVVPRSKVMLKTTQVDACVGFRDSLQLRIMIKNTGDADVPKGSIVRINAPPCYMEECKRLPETIAAVDGKLTIEMTLEPTGVASVDTLPDTITITITHPVSRLNFKTESAGIVVELHNFMGDVLTWRPQVPSVAAGARTLIFGPAGNGKSTLINNLNSLFKESYEAVAAAARDSNHVTKINQLITSRDQPRITYLDTVGLSYQTNNYKDGVLAKIVTGDLPHNYKVLEDNVAQALLAARTSGIDRKEREMHTAIVVATYGLRDEDAATQQVVRSYIQELNSMHLTPIIVVTNIDSITDSDELASLPATFEKITGIEKNRIYLLDNRPLESTDPGYFGQRRQLYKILRATLANVDLNHLKLAEARGVSLDSSGGGRGTSVTASMTSAAVSPGRASTTSSPSRTPIVARNNTSAAPEDDIVASFFSVELEDGEHVTDVYEPLLKSFKVCDIRQLLESDEDFVSKLSGFTFVNQVSNKVVPLTSEAKAPHHFVIRNNDDNSVAVVIRADSASSPPAY